MLILNKPVFLHLSAKKLAKPNTRSAEWDITVTDQFLRAFFVSDTFKIEWWDEDFGPDKKFGGVVVNAQDFACNPEFSDQLIPGEKTAKHGTTMSVRFY